MPSCSHTNLQFINASFCILRFIGSDIRSYSSKNDDSVISGTAQNRVKRTSTSRNAQIITNDDLGVKTLSCTQLLLYRLLRFEMRKRVWFYLDDVVYFWSCLPPPRPSLFTLTDSCGDEGVKQASRSSSGSSSATVRDLSSAQPRGIYMYKITNLATKKI